MTRILILRGLLALLIKCMAFNVFAYGNPIQIVTEQYPPYNYQEDAQIKGVSTQVVRAVLKEANIQSNIHLYPWARAYHMALHEENTLIYSISRTPNREALFKWVGVIAPIDFYIFAKTTRNDIRIKTLEDAKNYQIAVVREDALDQFFTNKEFTNLYRTNSNESAMQMLLSGHADLWPISEYAGYYFLKKKNHSVYAVQKLFHLKGFASGDQYMAFGQVTSDEVVDTFRAALQAIKEKGIYQQILNDYFE